MASLIIVKPHAPTAINYAPAGFGRALTADPKEVTPAAADFAFELDYGVPVTIDTAFFGYHNAPDGTVWSFQSSNGAGLGSGQYIAASQTAFSPGLGPQFHGFVRSPNPITSRYFLLSASSQGARAFYLGVFAAGLALQPAFGREYGSGRLIEDTGVVERLFGGGFGIDEGVATTGFQWTFGDLTASEVDPLFQLARERRTTRSILVVEDPDQTVGLNERIHWGLFRKLDAYERFAPGATRWSLSVWDWA